MPPEWKLRFNHSSDLVIDLRDAREKSFLLSPRFLELISERVKKSSHYKTKAVGIERVETPLGIKRDGARFYVLTIKTDKGEVRMLFELLPGEYSRLVGLNQTGLGKEGLKRLVMDAVYGGGVNEVEVLI